MRFEGYMSKNFSSLRPLRRLSQADSELLPFGLKRRSFLDQSSVDLSSVACVSATECPVLVNFFRTGSSTPPTPRAHLMKINRAHSQDSSDSPRVVTTPVRFAAAADCEQTALHFAAVPVGRLQLCEFCNCVQHF